MDETIEVLEKKRDGLYRELQDVGDFRRGIISVIYRKCGKKNCACAQPGHPGHGPVYLWNTTIKGKSYAKSLKLGPELQKYIAEIGNHKKFMKICEQIVVINERISDLRPVTEVKDEGSWASLKKIAEAIHQEVKNEIERILGRYLSDNVISIKQPCPKRAQRSMKIPPYPPLVKGGWGDFHTNRSPKCMCAWMALEFLW